MQFHLNPSQLLSMFQSPDRLRALLAWWGATLPNRPEQRFFGVYDALSAPGAAKGASESPPFPAPGEEPTLQELVRLAVANEFGTEALAPEARERLVQATVDRLGAQGVHSVGQLTA